MLALDNIEVAYDRTYLAIKGVSFTVPPGGAVALLGANGAGKSTTLKAISGLLQPERGEVTRGTIRFEGRDIGALAAPERVRLGLAQVLEGRRVFGHLTPRENLVAAASMHRDRAKVDELVDMVFGFFPRLVQRASAKAGYLSGGEQQMLAIGRALMAEPRLLMLDEPSLGLAPHLVEEIFVIIDRIRRERKMALLLVEQNAAAALEIVDHACLVENGTVVMEGTASALRSNADIQEAYLGRSGGVDYRTVKHYRRRRRWIA